MENKYKLVAIDMDGTLLNSKSEITPYTSKVLDAVSEEGIYVVFVTGRILPGVKIYPQIMEKNKWVIGCNGAYTVNTGLNTISFDNPLPGDICYKIIKILKSNSVIYQYFTFDHIVGEKIEKRMRYYYEVNSRLPEESRIRLRIVDDGLVSIQKEKRVYKLLLNIDDEEEFIRIKNQIDDIGHVSIYNTGKGMYDLMNIGVSKGAALERLAGQLEISREAVIAFGDSQNDISMLEFAGTGVAMGNAGEEVKRIADCAADTCDHDGVARKLIELLGLPEV